jgi:hypothetical protein
MVGDAAAARRVAFQPKGSAASDRYEGPAAAPFNQAEKAVSDDDKAAMGAGRPEPLRARVNLGLVSIFYEGLSVIAVLGPLSGILCFIYLFYALPQLKLARATFAMPPDDIEDRLAQAMAAIALTIEPNSQIGHSFTFRALGSRLV